MTFTATVYGMLLNGAVYFIAKKKMLIIASHLLALTIISSNQSEVTRML